MVSLVSKDSCELLRNAWHYTSRRFSLWDIILSVASAAGPAILLWGATPNSFHWIDAVNDLLKVAIWVGFVAGVFALRFLWNLWLAPYRRTKEALSELTARMDLYKNTLDQVAADIVHRYNTIEQTMADKHDLIERSFAMKLGSSESQIEKLSADMKEVGGQVAVLQVHFGGTLGDLANRLWEIENGKSK